MFRHAGRPLRPRPFRLYSNYGHKSTGGRSLLLVSTVAISTALLWSSSERVIHNDSSVPVDAKKLKIFSATIDGVLNALVWGSNKSDLLSEDSSEAEIIPTPSVTEWFKYVALRDLALHEKHAACVDARGDVYQWGADFFGSSKKDKKPSLTLRGKNIVSLQLTESRVFALSASGKIYVFSTESSKQRRNSGVSTVPTPSSRPWWSTGWMWGEDETIDFVELSPRETLTWGESFVSISAGRDHLLALTSSGRTFAHPITRNANTHGQLGFRKFDIPISTSSGSVPSRLAVELTPKSIVDPYAQLSPSTRPLKTSSQDWPNINDTDIRSSDTLFEINALKGVEISQIATGSRSSFAKTSAERILGWGANEYGQIGLGSNVTLDTITVPTEIVLSKMVSGRTRNKCLDIRAGGNLTCFTVERINEKGIRTVDLLMCGHGQWGGLGNNQFSSAQGTPVRAKNVSGLLEYNEATQTLEPISPHAVSVSPLGHVLLTLDTHTRAGPGGRGRDLFGWGMNQSSQLGNGKRSSLPSPTIIQMPDGNRLQLMKTNSTVKDLSGRLWKKAVEVEQHAIAGYGNSVIYWRIC